ncbi:Signal peptidase complex subunit 1 [Lamellibrachia satsuma]|nr:Signal peptidase complex subunit 1 [Lamellibrachia satsuma]
MDYLLPLVPEKIRNLPTHMDFDGQRRAERTFQVIIILFAVVGFIWGYICQQFSQTMYILCAGFLLSCVLTLPPWPIYRMKSLDWQKPKPTEDSVDSSTASSNKSKGKKK